MALVVNPKRRWILGIVAGFLLFMSLIVGALMQDPKDAPRATVERYSLSNGSPVVSLRLDAPRRRAMQVWLVAVEEPYHDGQSVVWRNGESQRVPEGELENYIRMSGSELLHPQHLSVKAGTSAQYDADVGFMCGGSPTGMIRLAVVADVEDRGVRTWQKRLGLCWQGKTLGPLRDRWAAPAYVLFRSDLITNAVPPAADAPRP
jgi:hypothetical protein